MLGALTGVLSEVPIENRAVYVSLRHRTGTAFASAGMSNIQCAAKANRGQMDRRLAAVIMATPSFASADMPTIKDKRTSSPCNLDCV